MTYDEGLADRIRAAVDAAAGRTGYREIAMFGGLCWTVNTHMAADAATLDAWVGPAVERARAKPPKPTR